MRSILTFSFILIALSSFSQTTPYDAALAARFGGDEYGMKMYMLVILKTGTNKTDDKAIKDSLFAGHMKNISRLADAGKLIVAGPIKKNAKEYRGIFILDAKTTEEAEAMLDTDPAIKGKLLEAELFQWYGSAALPAYLDTHKKIQKKSH